MQILRAESLLARNTLRLQSNARALVEVSSAPELADALDWARAEGLAVLPLGAGSNVVLAGDVDALVLVQRDGEMQVLDDAVNRVDLRVSAGHDWHALVRRTLDHGFYGLENLALIPGTVGAAPIQNIGAYGIELDRFVRTVHAWDIATGETLALSKDECGFGYRDSVFKGDLRDQVVITAVDLRLSRQASPELSYPALQQELEQQRVNDPQPEDVYRAVVDVRSRRLPDPAVEPNAGSFFKNPVVALPQAEILRRAHPELPTYPQADGRLKIPAAWLIDQTGWKGQRRGGVGVHPGHALVLVNYASESGAELLELADEIAASVQQRFGIALEIEPRVYGRRDA